MRDIEKLIAGANAAMREKLEENSFKPGWNDLTISEIMNYFEQENIELRMSIYILTHKLAKDKSSALKEVRREAADNINFLAFLIELCDREIQREDD